ncbi:TPA: hypothetical protein QHN47_004375 [Klebsiella aerogenes]|nr:hypothetical protein [Klebsiella aerogenes]HDT5519343.1 hypothetical protein [Klebsiella aerogenes]
MAFTKEKIQWLHDAATEFASAGLKMTMQPDEIQQLTEQLLAMLQGKALQLVGEVVAWNAPEQQGVYRNVDFRWIDINVAPGTKLYALNNEELTGG